jgi:hypothetical protein
MVSSDFLPFEMVAIEDLDLLSNIYWHIAKIKV